MVVVIFLTIPMMSSDDSFDEAIESSSDIISFKLYDIICGAGSAVGDVS